MDTEKRLVAFQTSRTDNQNHRHSNGGHRRFLDYDRPLQYYFDNCWVMGEDPETRDALPAEDWQLIDFGGNVILRGRDAIENVTGVLDFDDSWVMGEDPETRDALPDEDWQLIDSGGNVILRGRDAIECETGVLDFDGIYDTVVVKRLEDCDENELRLIAEAWNYVDKEILEYANRMLDNCRLTK